MRLLDRCPSCGLRDNIINSGGSESVQCQVCGAIWKDWSSLAGLIPFEASVLESDEGFYGVELSLPFEDQIPWIQGIRTIINTALILNFGLENFREGELRGLEWNNGQKSFRLTDMYGRLGLELVGERSSDTYLGDVLKFYLKLIEYLFDTVLKNLDGSEIFRGEIFRLSEEPENFKVFLEIVQLALVRARDSEFAQEVIKKSGIG